ncbi:MAG: arsenite efflux transporter metallochaperone ArsD [Planctomycetales bacterium]|nr:arsenite efflux transporter metallochaperone ArsD [Planctomycetales bacterium]
MSHVQIFDRAMCCSTGVCSPQVDPVLPTFAADLEWLKEKGHQVERFNLAHDAARFSENPTVGQLLATEGIECLPLVLVDGQIVSRNGYPVRENLALWTNTQLNSKGALPVVGGGRCADSGCC